MTTTLKDRNCIFTTIFFLAFLILDVDSHSWLHWHLCNSDAVLVWIHLFKYTGNVIRLHVAFWRGGFCSHAGVILGVCVGARGHTFRGMPPSKCSLPLILCSLALLQKATCPSKKGWDVPLEPCWVVLGISFHGRSHLFQQPNVVLKRHLPLLRGSGGPLELCWAAPGSSFCD